ncbi:MFS transporter [uncultured Clostridium sp.]|uniref:MFS transporter n=1 Tax=uncultured Clostridium sp. TaxID=59620 RepID=UPI0026133937|nr:MFS transporter [uncultured Clostridium sp.]
MNLNISLINQYKGLPKEIYIIFISRVINALGAFIGPLLTLILTVKIGLSTEYAGLIITLIGVITLPATMIGGKLADTYGRKKLFVITQSIACILFFSCGIFPMTIYTTAILAAACFVSDLGSPALSAMIYDLTTPENRTRCSSLNYLGWNLGFAIAPILGGFLLNNHIFLLFLFDSFTTIISIILIVLFIKETKDNSLLKVTDTDRHLEQATEGSIFKILLERKVLIFLSLIMLFLNFGYDQWGFLLPIEMTKLYGSFGAAHYGFIASFNGIIVVLFTPFLTKILSQTKNLKNIFIGALFYALALIIFTLFSNLFFIFLAMYFLTLGEIILSTNVPTYMANRTPKSHRGRLSGIIPIISGLGYIVGPTLTGALLKYNSYNFVWFLTFIIVIISTMFIPLLRRYELKKDI